MRSKRSKATGGGEMVSGRRLLKVRLDIAMAEKSPNLDSPAKRRALQKKELYANKRGTEKAFPNKILQRKELDSLVRTTKSPANESPAKKSPTHKRPSDKKTTKAVRKEGKSFQYRSNLIPLFKLIKAKTFSGGHIVALKKTPFWLLLDAFISKRVKYDHIRKDDRLIRDIIKTYSKETKAFKIGDRRITLTDKEISLIFGVKSGTLPLLSNLLYTTKMDSPFVRRHFNDVTALTKPLLEESFEKAFKGTTTTDFEDVARIMCLYLCSTLFFSNTGHSLKWGFVKCIEDLETIKDYGWSGAIRKVLMTSIKSVVDPEHASGCVVLLPYIIFEHTLLKTKADAQIPRFLKWDLRILATSMDQVEVTQLELAPNEEERNLLLELELVREETQEDDPQQKESQVHQTQALEVNRQEELHINTSSLLEKYSDAQSRILRLSLENEEFKEQIANLGAENSKLRDEIKKLRDEKKSETSRLVDVDEDEVDKAHNLTHDIAKKAGNAKLQHEVSTKKDTKSRRIKMKKLDDICLPVAKKQKKLHILEFPKNSEVLKWLKEEEKNKLQTMIETEDASSCMWKFQGLDVTVEHAVQLLNEGDISHNIIESFSDILMRTRYLPMDKGAHIFCNSWFLVTGKNEQLREQLLDSPVKKLSMTNYRCLIFPINSAGNIRRKDPYHWTVLVCDNCTQQWIHYNSVKPRNMKVDPYFKDALVVKEYIEELRKTINNKATELGTSTPHCELLTPEYKWEIVSCESCPQQKYSADCGIIACYVMHCWIRNSTILSNFDKEQVQRYRAHILKRLLKDIGHSSLEDYSMMEQIPTN